jgi:hypothetical protein
LLLRGEQTDREELRGREATMGKKLVGLAGLVGVAAVSTRVGEAMGVKRLQCGCLADCWCKRSRLSMFRWLVPGRFHHLADVEGDRATQ